MASPLGATFKHPECSSLSIGCCLHDFAYHPPHREAMMTLDETIIKDISKKHTYAYSERTYGFSHTSSAATAEEAANLALDQDLKNRALFRKAQNKSASYALFGRTVQERQSIAENHHNAMLELSKDIHQGMRSHMEAHRDPSGRVGSAAWLEAAGRSWPGWNGTNVADARAAGRPIQKQARRKHPSPREVDAEVTDAEIALTEAPVVSELHRLAAVGEALAAAAYLDQEGLHMLLVPTAEGTYPLHAAASSRSPACIALLLDRHLALDPGFDPQRLPDGRGQTAPAQAADSPDCGAAFRGAWPELAASPADAVWMQSQLLEQPFRRLTFQALVVSPLAGDLSVHFQRHQVAVTEVIEGLHSAEEGVRRRHPAYAHWLEQRQGWVEALTEEPHQLWRTHLSAAAMATRLRAAFDTWRDAAFVGQVVALYTAPSFLRPAVDAALLHLDEAQTHLAPFIQTLHWALRSAPLAQRHRGPAFRAAALTDPQRARYAAAAANPRAGRLTLPGFAAVCAAPEGALQSLAGPANTLFIIRPSDDTDPNCCPADVRSSAVFPEERGIMYPLRQQFQVLRAGYCAGSDLASRLDMVGLLPPDLPAQVYVVELVAVDPFWALADRLFDGAEDVSDLVPLLERRLACDAALYGATDLRVAKAHSGLGTCCRLLRRFDDALEQHRKAVALRRAALPADHPEMAAAYHGLALVYYALGDYDVALELEARGGGQSRSPSVALDTEKDPLVLYQKAIALSRVALGDNHPDVGEAFRNLAMAFEAQGKYDAALELYQKAQRIAQANEAGAAPPARGDYGTDLELYARAVDMCRRALGQDGPNGEEARKLQYRVARSAAGDPVVLEVLLKALAMRAGVAGSSPADVGAAYLARAADLKAAEDYELAQDLYQKALGLRRAALGDRHPAVAEAYNLLGAMYSAEQQYGAAAAMHERAMGIYLFLGADYMIDLGHTYAHLGGTRLLQGDPPAAIAVYGDAVRVFAAGGDATAACLADAYSGLGLAHYTAGAYPAALAAWQSALALRCAALPEAHPDVIALYQNLLMTYRALEDVESWRAMLRKVDTLIVEMDGSVPKAFPDDPEPTS